MKNKKFDNIIKNHKTHFFDNHKKLFFVSVDISENDIYDYYDVSLTI